RRLEAPRGEPMQMRVRTRGSWRLAVAAATALVATSLAAVAPGPVGAEPRFVTVVSPADGHQAPADGTVPVEVALKHNVNPSTFRATLEGGGATTDVSDLFSAAGSTITGTLTSDQLSEGINVLTVSAQRGSGSSRRPSDAGQVHASVSVSWEPRVD